jgi:hypothetical protein
LIWSTPRGCKIFLHMGIDAYYGDDCRKTGNPAGLN